MAIAPLTLNLSDDVRAMCRVVGAKLKLMGAQGLRLFNVYGCSGPEATQANNRRIFADLLEVIAALGPGPLVLGGPTCPHGDAARAHHGPR